MSSFNRCLQIYPSLILNKIIFVFSAISAYSTVHTNDAVYIFGGYPTEASTLVAEYKNDQWKRLPDLKNGRWFHASIRMGPKVLIYGGRAASKSVE